MFRVLYGEGPDTCANFAQPFSIQEEVDVTYFISKDSRSHLNNGVETIVIPIVDEHDLRILGIETERGIHAVVEWLLSQLGRFGEVDRVCGLTVSIVGEGKVVVNLELRQAGRQIEERLSSGQWTWPEAWPKLSDRSLETTRFSDIHKPYWIQ